MGKQTQPRKDADADKLQPLISYGSTAEARCGYKFTGSRKCVESYLCCLHYQLR
jgi:hypothetical protein